MGVDVSEGDQPESQGAATERGLALAGPALRTVRLEGLVLLDTAGTEPVAIEAMLFADDGIGVIRARGDRPRVLPWTSLSAHAVEKWVGGEIPAHWLQPGDTGGGQEPWAGTAPVPPPPPPPRPRVAAGALIGIQTSYGTYRFLFPGGDPAELSRRVTAFAVRHQGPAAASTVTRVVDWGHDVERRQSRRPPPKPAGWARAQPYLVVLLLVFIASVVTLILLQTAGTIHLPLLGGSGSGAGAIGTHGVFRTP
jgi:hypothetical protein